MTKQTNVKPLSIILLIFVYILAGCATIPSKIPSKILDQNTRIGVVALMPHPIFTTTSGVAIGKLPAYSHKISGFNFARSIENNVITTLKQASQFTIVSLHYNYDTDLNYFIQNAFLKNHLDYLITFKPGIYSETQPDTYIHVFGYGLLYTNHVGWLKTYSVVKGYAKINIYVTNRKQHNIAHSFVNISKELRKSTWAPTFNKLNKKDITAFTSWVHQEIIPETNNAVLKMLRLNQK